MQKIHKELLIIPDVKKEHMTPVPWPIAVRLASLPAELGDREYHESVRKIVREELVPVKPDINKPGPFRLYDGQVWRIIREVMQEN